MISKKILRIVLFSGFAYFFLMALAHTLGIKVPGLFIYYNVPSYEYQDRIISVLTFGWSVFFLKAAINPIRNQNIIQILIIIGAVAIAGLIRINYGTDFAGLNPEINPVIFWYETGGLFLYWLILLVSSRNFFNTEV